MILAKGYHINVELLGGNNILYTMQHILIETTAQMS